MQGFATQFALTLAVATTLAAAASSSGFKCSDLSVDCPQWKRNMGGNCRGQDYGYMLHNCPRTCKLCREAKEKYETEEEERRKNPTYEPHDSKVVVLTGDTIDDFIETEGENSIILLEFYAPWCGHCQHVAADFREAASILHAQSAAGKLPTPVILAKFDAEDPANRAYGATDLERWNFTSYPTMFVVGSERFPYEERLKNHYAGDKDDAQLIVRHMTFLAEGMDQKQAYYAALDVEKLTKPGMYKVGGRHETEHLVELDTDNFRDVVLRSDEVWVVEFYSDKCPICNTMAPQ